MLPRPLGSLADVSIFSNSGQDSVIVIFIPGNKLYIKSKGWDVLTPSQLFTNIKSEIKFVYNSTSEDKL